MSVPFLDLPAQYKRIKEEVDGAVAQVFASQQFVGGPNVVAFEAEIARYLGATDAVGVASGTDALLLALKACGIKANDEVITTPFTFFATAGSIVNAGARPVFVDIDPETYNIDPTGVERHITARTRAIVPVHLYGQCADMEPLLEIAGRHGLTVVEDAAQAIGAMYKGRLACTMGRAAALSFYPTKNLGAAGDGGMVVTMDRHVSEAVRLLRHHGQNSSYCHAVVGTNSRLDALQAAVLLVKMRHLEEWTRERRARAAYYNERLKEIPEIQTPVERAGNYHIYHQYVVRLPKRDAARAFLSEKGIGSSVFYPVPLHRQDCFKAFGYPEDACPEADKTAAEVLALPIYAELTPDQQDEVVAALKMHIARC
jgi:dTDP-4-amino-4,6-dideoxygalactose transaminase